MQLKHLIDFTGVVSLEFPNLNTVIKGCVLSHVVKPLSRAFATMRQAGTPGDTDIPMVQVLSIFTECETGCIHL